jgi:subtilisin family serine protease
MYRGFRILATIALAMGLLGFAIPKAATTQASTAETYVILYNQQAVPSDAATMVANAGGTFVYGYDKIGVVIASSSDTAFAAKVKADKRVEGVSSTASFGVQLTDEFEVVDAADTAAASTATDFNDPLSVNQWDMFQIHVPEAQEVNAGSPSVVVGDIDTGLDWSHPDLAANVDFANSVSCVSGVPNTDPAAWMDDNGHGTHTAGTIAAAKNGIGIIGVAPNVKIAGIKAGNADGYFFPEAVICSFYWAATHNIDVTNNSYYADPWLFNCRNDAEQRAIWKAEQRAINYAMQKGVTVVAAAGNENIDLSKRNIDSSSPDDGTPVTREVTNACVVIPVEIPGVIGVSADGNLMEKSYYSTYGVSAVQVVAPGGDSRYQRTAAAPRGTVYSTYPNNRYAYAQGTSMASPHAAGVAALIVSQFGKMMPGRVQAMLNQTADPMACPENPFRAGTNYEATCTGGEGYNSFYGHGQINAFNAVTHTT